ncbi:hypothetical protein L2725_02070 [Shewanella corallii]|uniref:Uncharacterized protein n=2 Tax=Shewanella TaxID=22 RepID=A0ABT0N2A8_9GAMM|nr:MULTISPECIES: hypothetical protein [Shewanella]MCL1035966.1 hypothetical protein [Shewanella submarina]MCL2912581.1 hypothetical protein [Shewanella corallii]
MEFILFCLVFAAAALVAFKPEKEKLASRLLVSSILLSVFIWIVMTAGMIIPPGNL